MLNQEELEKKFIQQVTDEKNNLSTDRLDMSYGELISMYERKDMVIAPNFQRLFRWDNNRRSRFIESILLGIPTPPIFVAEDSESVWELVDGLQRISTILSFFGKLDPDENNDNNWELEKGSLIPLMEGYTGNTLPLKFRRNILRTYCRVEIIKWDSKYDLRYELFDRLNTGGVSLTNQEIRNAIYRGKSEDFNLLIEELSNNKDFNNIIDITENQYKTLYHHELVLRFFALYFTELEEIDSANMGIFMTNFMKKSTEKDGFNYEGGKQIFERTFKYLNELNMPTIFKFNNNKFSTSLFDAITTTFAKKIDIFEKNIDSKLIIEWIEELKELEEFRNHVGSASSSKSRVIRKMEISSQFFNDKLESINNGKSN